MTITLIKKIVTSGSQSSVNFTSIPHTFSALKVLWVAADTQPGTALVAMRMQINGDAVAANYSAAARIGTQNGAGISAPYPSTTNGFGIGALPQSGVVDAVASGEFTFVNYAGPKTKSVFGVYQTDVTTVLVQTSGRWALTAPIAQLTFLTEGTAFVDGLPFALYGLS